MRPCPEVRPHPLRGAAYEPHHQVVVLHGGEGAGHGTVVYDLQTNTWHEMNPPQPVPAAGISQPGFTFASLRYLGQALGTFLVFEGPGSLVLLDQHAAHERVLFERMRQMLLEGKLERQKDGKK